MADLLGTGVSALTAMQRALATTSNNIANVGTDGYSRQRVEFSNRSPSLLGDSFIGTGVDATSVSRVFNAYVNQRVNTTTSSFNREQAFLDLSNQIDNLLGDADTGLAGGLQGFFNALQDLANDPTSVAARQVVLTDAATLVDRFAYVDQRLNDLRGQANAQLQALVVEVNSIANNIATLNTDIVSAAGRGQGAQPNDLLDQRDALVRRLSELVTVNTIEQDNGALNVFVGTGQSLVIGSATSPLSATPLGADINELNIAYQPPTGAAVDITDLIQGGQLGGIIAFRDQALDPTQNAVGRLAYVVAESFNAQHRRGMDLQGNLGGDFFIAPQPRIFAEATNTGAISLAISDSTALTTDDYRLGYDGSNWNLTRASTGAAVTLSGTGTALDPFVAEGLSIVVTTPPAAGDSFTLRPTRFGGSEIGLAIQSPRELAAASPVYGEAAAANTGSGTATQPLVVDPTDTNLLSTVNIVFETPPSTYTVNGGPSQAYTAGAAITVNGWSLNISGVPAAGDTFTVSANNGGVGDNRNALELVGLRNTDLMEGGGGPPTATFDEAYSQLVARVGVQSLAADTNADAQRVLLAQAEAERESVSGVNLDEEAADLLRFQQAYQAAAQVISVADSLFQTLLDATRR